MNITSVQKAGGYYGHIREEYQADAWLYGTSTTKEFVRNKAELPQLPIEKVPMDYVSENQADLYYDPIDIYGEIMWESNTF